jgi:hypothetical protein
MENPEVVVDGLTEFFQEFIKDFERAMEEEIRQNEIRRLSMTVPEFPEL